MYATCDAGHPHDRDSYRGRDSYDRSTYKGGEYDGPEYYERHGDPSQYGPDSGEYGEGEGYYPKKRHHHHHHHTDYPKEVSNAGTCGTWC
jgi:hypothetical protein